MSSVGAGDAGSHPANTGLAKLAIAAKILVLRGVPVMLDSDLAAL